GRDDRQVRSSTGRLDRDQELLQAREGLEDEHVDPSLQQSLDLLLERVPGGSRGAPRELARGWVKRADRATDEGVAAADLARLSSHLRRAQVEPSHVVLEPVDCEAMPVRPERECLDELR